MAATVVAGLDCKLYRNTATYATPTWNEVTIARDVQVPITVAKADASSRLSRYKMFRPGHIDVSIDFDMIADTEIDDYDAIKAAMIAQTILDVAVADGAIATALTQYWRSDVYVFEFSGDQGMNDAAGVSVSCAPAYSTSHSPVSVEVA